MSDVQDPPVLIHLHLSDSTPVEEEEITLADGKTAKVLWKDVLVEGEYPMSPSAGGATSDPMRVITDGSSDPATKTIAMSDLEASHAAGAFKYVTIPTSHKDTMLENTGYVPRPSGLRRVTKRGKTVLQAALGFTEPDIKGKVMRGTIPDVSAGIFFNWTNKAQAKLYPAAMKHVALTPVPFMGNLDPFPAVFAADEEVPDNTTVEAYHLADEDTGGSSDTGKTAEVVWNETASYGFIRAQIDGLLNPKREEAESVPYEPRPSYYCRDVSSEDTALVEEFYKGEQKKWVIPFTRADDGTVSLAPSLRWVEVREAMIAASDTAFEELASSTLREKLGIALSENLGHTDAVYRVQDVSLDNRARIVCAAKGAEWLAQFAVLDNGSVWLAPADRWERVSTPVTTPKDEEQRPASSTSSVALTDDMEERLRAARQRRRQMLSPTNPRKEV
jgi:hypothetical protein